MSDWIDISAMLRPAVYLLWWDRQVLYVGQSRCPLVRIYTHRNFARKRTAPWVRLQGIRFNRASILPTRIEDLDRVERELIALYDPPHNTLLKPKHLLDISAMFPGIKQTPRPLVDRRI